MVGGLLEVFRYDIRGKLPICETVELPSFHNKATSTFTQVFLKKGF